MNPWVCLFVVDESYYDEVGLIGDGIDLGRGVRNECSPHWLKRESILRNFDLYLAPRSRPTRRPSRSLLLASNLKA